MVVRNLTLDIPNVANSLHIFRPGYLAKKPFIHPDLHGWWPMRECVEVLWGVAKRYGMLCGEIGKPDGRDEAGIVLLESGRPFGRVGYSGSRKRAGKVAVMHW